LDNRANDLPAIELLESVHHFPCRYIFKAIGRVDNGFAARIVAAVRDELQADTDPPFSCRQTAGGRHIAVTLEPHLESVEQVLAIYRRIQAVPGLVLLF
jgi:putative lipoic acid-binding regulatory protein